MTMLPAVPAAGRVALALVFVTQAPFQPLPAAPRYESALGAPAPPALVSLPPVNTATGTARSDAPGTAKAARKPMHAAERRPNLAQSAPQIPIPPLPIASSSKLPTETPS